MFQRYANILLVLLQLILWSLVFVRERKIRRWNLILYPPQKALVAALTDAVTSTAFLPAITTLAYLRWKQSTGDAKPPKAYIR